MPDELHHDEYTGDLPVKIVPTTSSMAVVTLGGFLTLLLTFLSDGGHGRIATFQNNTREAFSIYPPGDGGCEWRLELPDGGTIPFQACGNAFTTPAGKP